MFFYKIIIINTILGNVTWNRGPPRQWSGKPRNGREYQSRIDLTWPLVTPLNCMRKSSFHVMATSQWFTPCTKGNRTRGTFNVRNSGTLHSSLHWTWLIIASDCALHAICNFIGQFAAVSVGFAMTPALHLSMQCNALHMSLDRYTSVDIAPHNKVNCNRMYTKAGSAV